MILDRNRIAGKLEHVIIVDAETVPISFRRLDIARGMIVAPRIDHAPLLAPQRVREDGTKALLERRLMHVEFIGIDRTLDDVFAESVGAGNERNVAEARFRIEREHDAARRLIRADHLHDTDRQRHLEVIEPIIDAIRNCTVGKDRGEAPATGLDYGALAPNV